MPSDQVVVIAVGLVAALIAGLMVWLLLRGLNAAGRAGDRETIRHLQTRLGEISTERDQARRRAEELALQVAELRSQSAADQERMQWLTRAETSLRETFESLASRTLQASTRSLMEQSREQLQQFALLLKSDWGAQKQEIRGVMEPLAAELQKLDRHVRTLEERREGAYQGLTEQVRTIGEQYRNLQQATTSLDQALRSPTVRGKWGEVQLRRLVEMAGMIDHVDFDEQASGTSAAGGRPDMIIRLPSEAILPVDAKAPMSAYLDAQEAGSPELAEQALRRHAQALRAHVQALAQKAYWSQFDRAPEFVVMVVPYESGLASAFTTDPGLLEYALANKVVVAAPASFLALLRVVAYGWMQLELSRNAQAIASGGRELLERLQPFAGHLNRLGGALNQAVERYNDAAGSFERRILPTARKLQELGAASEAPPEVVPSDARARTVTPPDGGD
jgi:DNA recombination protein RmuC